MEKYIITKDEILLITRVAATLEIAAALETEKDHSSKYCAILKDLAADLYDIVYQEQEKIQDPKKEKNILPENKKSCASNSVFPICGIMLHPFDIDDFDGEEDIQLFMHKYPESTPEYYGQYLILDKNNNYHVAYFSNIGEFADPNNDYQPYPKDFIVGWLAIY